MDRKTKYQWMSYITVLVSMQVSGEVAEKYGNRARLYLVIIPAIVMAGAILFFIIFGKKSQRKQAFKLIPFSLAIALMVYTIYLDNMILQGISLILFIITCLLTPKILKLIENRDK